MTDRTPVATEILPWTHYRARIAALSRERSSNDPELVEARRNLRAARLAEHIEKVVAQAPPITDAQRDRLAVLLYGGVLPQKPRPETENERRAREEREERDRKAKSIRDYAASLLACAICGIPEVAHRIQQTNSALGFHDWQPQDVPE